MLNVSPETSILLNKAPILGSSVSEVLLVSGPVSPGLNEGFCARSLWLGTFGNVLPGCRVLGQIFLWDLGEFRLLGLELLLGIAP